MTTERFKFIDPINVDRIKKISLSEVMNFRPQEKYSVCNLLKARTKPQRRSYPIAYLLSGVASRMSSRDLFDHGEYAAAQNTPFYDKISWCEISNAGTCMF